MCSLLPVRYGVIEMTTTTIVIPKERFSFCIREREGQWMDREGELASERERERDRETERQRQRDRDRDRQTDRQRQTETETDRQTDRVRSESDSRDNHFFFFNILKDRDPTSSVVFIFKGFVQNP